MTLQHITYPPVIQHVHLTAQAGCYIWFIIFKRVIFFQVQLWKQIRNRLKCALSLVKCKACPLLSHWQKEYQHVALDCIGCIFRTGSGLCPCCPTSWRITLTARMSDKMTVANLLWPCVGLGFGAYFIHKTTQVSAVLSAEVSLSFSLK